MKKKYFITAIACLFAASNYSSTCFSQPQLNQMPIITVNINHHPFQVWVAISIDQYRKGLKGVSAQELQGKGMIFSYPKHYIPSYTMQGTLTDIDLLCLDEMGTVLQIIHMKTKKTALYTPSVPCRFGLELPKGSTALCNLKLGDKVLFTKPV